MKRKWLCAALAAVMMTGLLVVSAAAPASALTATSQISVGGDHSCALSAGGVIYCWGRNISGQLGDGTVTDSSKSVRPTAAGVTWAAVSAASSTTCALTTAGAAYCWGVNTNWQIGDGTNTNRTVPTLVSGGLTFTSIAAGSSQSCGLSSSGVAYCWGGNSYGQIGDGTTTTRSTPTPVSGGLTFTFLTTSSTSAESCGIASGGAAYCWGYNSYGQIGDGTIGTNRVVPTLVSGGLSFSSLSIGGPNICGLLTSGAAYCWGSNFNGNIGDGTLTNYTTPEAVSGGLTFSSISVGGSTVCALSTSSIAYCWGRNFYGQMGDGTTNNLLVPTAVLGGLTFSSIGTGINNSCGIVIATQRVACWGDREDGGLADGQTLQSNSPVRINNANSYKQIGSGQYFACGLKTSGSAYCWGSNNTLQLGVGSTNAVGIDQGTPVAVSGTYTSLAVNSGSVCGLISTGAVNCWGLNSSGQIGDGTTNSRSTPVAVSGGLVFTSISGTGGNTVCGLIASGAAYCWGSNTNGQIGDGTTTNRTAPTLVSGGLTFSSISTGSDHTCALTNAGVAYCWGSNSSYRLGNGTQTQQTVPTAVSGGLTFNTIAVGFANSCGLVGTAAYCWGYGASGANGQGTNSDAQTPTLVLGGLAFSSVIPGDWQTCGVTTTGRGYCWGYNSNGQVGDGSTTNRLSPVAVATAAGFSQIAPSSYNDNFTCGTNGTELYCWGQDNYGQFGDYSFTQSSPVQTYVFLASNADVASVTIDPSFTFTVSNASTTCNGESNFVSTAGSATGVALAHVGSNANVSGGQALSVASNAGSGFSVYVRGAQSSQNLRSTTYNWSDVSGTYASPAGLGTGEAFGYTYKDLTSGTSLTNPASANFVALDGTNRAIMNSVSAGSGSSCVSFDAQSSPTTPAGSYAATIVYIAVPAF